MKTFMDYLTIVFKFAGTYSLNKTLRPCNYGMNFSSKLKTGDILIHPADIMERVHLAMLSCLSSVEVTIFFPPEFHTYPGDRSILQQIC